MAITLVAAVGNQEAAAGTAIALPAGGQADDIYVVTYFCFPNETGSLVINDMTGWTSIYDSSSFKPDAYTRAHRSFYVRRESSNPPTASPTTTPSGKSLMYNVTLWRGCATSGSPIHTYAINNKTSVDTSMNWSAPAVTTTVANTRNIVTYMYKSGGSTGASVSTPSGYTEHVDYYLSAYLALVATSSKEITSTGSTGAQATTVTSTGDTNQYLRAFAAVTINLAPPVEASPKPPIIIMCGI